MHLQVTHRKLRGLGDGLPVDFTGAAALLKAVGGASAGGGAPGAAMPSTSTTVSTQVSTQVNPQISPVFVQQSSPSNSPINASPQAFAVPQPLGTPITGAIPGFDNASGYAPTGVPTAFSAPKSGIAIAAAVALAVGAAFMLRKKKRK